MRTRAERHSAADETPVKSPAVANPLALHGIAVIRCARLCGLPIALSGAVGSVPYGCIRAHHRNSQPTEVARIPRDSGKGDQQ